MIGAFLFTIGKYAKRVANKSREPGLNADAVVLRLETAALRDTLVNPKS
jgi:hypothetical protein